MTAKPMTLDRFRELAAAWGSEIERWPSAERDAAQALADADLRAAEALVAQVDLDLWLDRPEAPSTQLRLRILDDAARIYPQRGFWSRLWEELGGFRLVAPAFASSLVLAVILVQLDPSEISADGDDGELISLALLSAEDEEYLP